MGVFLNFLLYFLIGYSSPIELESIQSNRITVVVPVGMQFKLNVTSIYYYAKNVWQLNGYPISPERCTVDVDLQKYGRSILTCAHMYCVDQGMYEYLGITNGGQNETIMAVNVKISPSCPNKCFCSGVTDNCVIANFFRSKIVVILAEINVVDYGLNKTETIAYYQVPNELKGNLLKSYGGYLNIPPTGDMERNQPDIILQGGIANQTILFFGKQNNLSVVQLSETEDGWQRLDGGVISRNTFLSVLARVDHFYIKYNHMRAFGSIVVVLDSADTNDRGFGHVTTVEQCNCHTGYKGLSCESCSNGFSKRVIENRVTCIPRLRGIFLGQ